MLIDWPTTLFQIINFLILIYLLKRFLYGPIIRAMEEREKRIANAMTQARKAEEEAKKLSLDLTREKQALNDAREGLIAKAKEEVREWRENAMDSAKEEVEKLKATWVDGLNRDRQVFFTNLKKNIAEQVILIGEKVLRDLASDDLERQIVRVFLKKIDGTDDIKDLVTVSKDVLIQSGFALNDDISGELRTQLAGHFPKAQDFHFELDRDLGIGIQVKVNNLKIEWNLKEYLNELEKEILNELFSHGREVA